MPYTSNSLILPQKVRGGYGTLNPADGTNLITIMAAGANGTKVVGFACTSYDSVLRTLRFYVQHPGGNFCLGAGDITPYSGLQNGTPHLNAMRQMAGLPLDNDGQPYILLEAGDNLQFLSTAAVSAGGFIQSYAWGADF
jgi:hypothetical protein